MLTTINIVPERYIVKYRTDTSHDLATLHIVAGKRVCKTKPMQYANVTLVGTSSVLTAKYDRSLIQSDDAGYVQSKSREETVASDASERCLALIPIQLLQLLVLVAVMLPSACNSHSVIHH